MEADLAAHLPAALALVAALQGLCLAVDELLYHRRRGLGPFEALGHPIDTALFLPPLLLAALAPPGRPGWLWAYLGLAVLSCLVITKDEWIHAERCPGGEQWLHAVLFLLHPVVLIALGAAWQRGQALALRRALPLPVLAFLAYQLAYWQLAAWRARRRAAPRPYPSAPPSSVRPERRSASQSSESAKMTAEP